MTDILTHAVNGLVFIAWIACMVWWIKGGCSVPRWVHMLAVTLQLLGVGIVIACGIAGILHLQLLLLFLLVPAPATYFGWLWMFGPSLRDSKN